MGNKNKSKDPGKTPKSAPQTGGAMEEASPPSTRDSSPPRLADLDGADESLQEEFHIDYKQLALEVARQISPDIQETLAETVTSMLSKIQSKVSQHGQRLDQLEARLHLLETDSKEMQCHLQAALQENKKLGEKVEDLVLRLKRLLGQMDIPQNLFKS